MELCFASVINKYARLLMTYIRKDIDSYRVLLCISLMTNHSGDNENGNKVASSDQHVMHDFSMSLTKNVRHNAIASTIQKLRDFLFSHFYYHFDIFLSKYSNL